MFVCLSGFRLCRRSSSRQGHGLRFAPGTRLAQLADTLASLAGRPTVRPNLALGGPMPAEISIARRQTERAARVDA